MKQYIFLTALLILLEFSNVYSDFSIIYEFSTQQRRELHELYQKGWWTNTRTIDDVDVILEHSLALGLIDNETNLLIGFTRVISDQFKYAFIFDVLLEEAYRKKGLGKLLMETALNHPALKRVTVFELHCLPDMMPFYQKMGFKEDFASLRALRLVRT